MTKKAIVVIDFADFIVNSSFYFLYLVNREILFRYSFIKSVLL